MGHGPGFKENLRERAGFLDKIAREQLCSLGLRCLHVYVTLIARNEDLANRTR